MKIVVLSCDKNGDLFEPFKICMDKYWKEHPEVIYLTETIKNPYYKTINKNYPLDLWSKRIRESLKEIDDNQIILMIDDCFIREPVDVKRIEYLEKQLKGNIALFNFEKSFDPLDEECKYEGFKKRNPKGIAIASLMCGMWQKDKLIDALNITCQPWEIERLNITHGYEYYINSGEYIINFGYVYPKPFSLYRGRWCKEVKEFFKKEGIEIDYSTREHYD